MIKHSLATYPGNFLGYVISDTKICLQFEKVIGKLRFKDGAEYVKLPSTEKAMCITTTGTDIDILAVGCQLPTIETLQKQLLSAYLQYGELKADIYETTYGRPFLEFLISTKKELEDVIRKTEARKSSLS